MATKEYSERVILIQNIVGDVLDINKLETAKFRTRGNSFLFVAA